MKLLENIKNNNPLNIKARAGLQQNQGRLLGLATSVAIIFGVSTTFSTHLLAQDGGDHIGSRIFLKSSEMKNFKMAFKILELTGQKKLWPNWNNTTRKTWYVSGGYEYYFCAESKPKGYEKVDHIRVAKKCNVYAKPTTVRDYKVSTATIGTTPPMIIIGSPRRKSSLWMPWVAQWLHEHTHQWQMSLEGYASKAKALDLGDEGDEGNWMLHYDFPYDDRENNRNFKRMAGRLIELLDTLKQKQAPARVRKSVYKYLEAKLNFKQNISQKDYRFFAFTNWQEGIAKYTEYKALQVALKVSSWKKDKHGKHPIPLMEMKKIAKLADYSYHKMIDVLGAADLDDDKRYAFYALGAVEAVVLDYLVKDWRKHYLDHPFQLDWAFEQWFKRNHQMEEGDLWKDRDDEATRAWKRFFKNDGLK